MTTHSLRSAGSVVFDWSTDGATLVQPTLAVGLLLLLVLGVRILGEKVGPREIGAVILIIVSVGVFAWAAPREPGEVDRGPALVVALAILAAIAATPYVIGFIRRTPNPMPSRWSVSR